jgi:hypothetical protein
VLEYVPIGEFDVTYLEGDPDIARANFAAVMELESEYAETPAEKIPGGTVLARAVWMYLGRPKDSLAEWAKNVHTIVPRPNGKNADPSPPAVGDE